MAIRFYADENYDGKIVRGLRARGIDVLTVVEDQHNGSSDDVIFQRASELDRVLLSHDDDMLRIAYRWQHDGLEFSGLIYSHAERATVRQCIENLDPIWQFETAEQYISRIEYLPL